jgi:hypothetical protein
MIPQKGPVGKPSPGSKLTKPEPQEQYESYGDHKDLCTYDIAPIESLKALEGDHTPDNSAITHGIKVSKPNYGKSEGRGNGGVGL